MYRAKGQFSQEEILSEGAVIGGMEFKICHGAVR